MYLSYLLPCCPKISTCDTAIKINRTKVGGTAYVTCKSRPTTKTRPAYCSTFKYTHIFRIKGCGGAGWPPPPIIFERLKLPQQIIYRRKENLSESPNHQKYWENILVSRFYEQFSRNRRNLGHFRKFEKISNSQNMNILYIILKHVIWRFQIYNLFREIFKFREDKSNNVFREIRKCFRKTAKFEFFAKQIIYLESPDHVLQNDI